MKFVPIITIVLEVIVIAIFTMIIVEILLGGVFTSCIGIGGVVVGIETSCISGGRLRRISQFTTLRSLFAFVVVDRQMVCLITMFTWWKVL